jgi:hypothetical protein
LSLAACCLPLGAHFAAAPPRYSTAWEDGLAAALINCFISLTALSIPVIKARATMLWPMFSSRIPSSAATGWTLRYVSPCPACKAMFNMRVRMPASANLASSSC